MERADMLNIIRKKLDDLSDQQIRNLFSFILGLIG